MALIALTTFYMSLSKNIDGLDKPVPEDSKSRPLIESRVICQSILNSRKAIALEMVVLMF